MQYRGGARCSAGGSPVLARSGHRLANAIVAALVMAIALCLFHRLAINVGLWYEYPSFAFALNSLNYTWGPLLYLYTFCLTRGSLSHRQCLHFLPAVLAFLAMNLPLWQSSSTGQEQLIRHMWGEYPELAVEVGFKSKSSFYDAFKRATNMTPTQFKRAMEKPPEGEDQP